MPMVAGLTPSSDSGSSSSDGITSDAAPTVTGSAEANTTVSIYVDGTRVGRTTANSSGAWSYTLGSALSEGSHGIRGDATDAAGNRSAQSSASTVTIDRTAPLATSIVDVAGPTNTRTSSYVVTFNEPVSGVDAEEFNLITTGSATAQVAAVTQIDAHTYSITLSGVQG